MTVPCARVIDRPRFGWRGMLLDCSRHFMDKNFVKRTIDLPALHKMNRFHWHLTDDQGWRLEIRKYPRLTSVGAWRADHETEPWSGRSPRAPGEKATYGGYYTQDEVRAIALSRDGGRSWGFLNPATFFPASYGGFCCDQVVYYDQSHDITIWILQYTPNGSGNNAIRVAWANGVSALSNASFCWTDFTPQQLGSPSGTNYDQPKFARSDNDYYLEMTQYGAAGGSIVIRFAASALTPACSGVGYGWYAPGLFSPGFTQRGYSDMYFAAHVSNSTLRVFDWPESAASWTGITTHDVLHTAYPANYPYSCPRAGGTATSDWCQRRSFGGGGGYTPRNGGSGR